MNEYSFEKGWGQVQQKDVEAVREQIMLALGATTFQTFRQRKKGTVEPKVSEKAEIERIFNEFGITEIWG